MPSLMTEDDRNRKREELRANWKIPAVAQFVSLHRIAFKLPEIEIEDLEEGLINEEAVERKILIELLVAILRGINCRVNAGNWSTYLRRLVKKRFIPEEGKCNPYLPDSNKEEGKKARDCASFDAVKNGSGEISLTEDSFDNFDISFLQRGKESIESTFWSFDTSTQADILHFLCLTRLDRLDAVDAMKTMDADALRAQPLGCDDVGNEYWYFYGTRLYKQAPAPKSLNWEAKWSQQKEEVFKKRKRGRPPKKVPCKQRKSDGESDDFEDVDAVSNRRFMNIDEKSRWSVVCNTIEDWVDFAEKFKESKSKCEKALFEIVQENFLPALNDIYQEKERRLKEKLKGLIPQRSTIIERRETRRHRTTVHNSLESDELENETAHREHLKRNRAHRLEERNRRANEEAHSPRVTRSSAKYYNEDNDEEIEESEELCDDSTESSNDDKFVIRDYYPLYSVDGIDVKPEILKLIGEVKVHKDAWPFINPVKKEEAPGYYEIISQPIDLSIITQKLLNGTYQTVTNLDADFRKLVSNCRLYNGEHGGPTKMVNTVYKIFQRGVAKILEEHRMYNESASYENETSHVTVTAKYSRTEVISKKRTNSHDGKRRKRKVRHMEAIEALSRESELAVEKSNSNGYLESLQATSICKQDTSFSNLKIIPIHSNPTELIEKYMPESSNQGTEDSEKSNDTSSFMEEENVNSLQNFDLSSNADSLPSPDHCGYFESRNNDDNCDASVFADKGDSSSNSSTQEIEENDNAAIPSDQQSRSSSINSPNGYQQSSRKSSSSSSEGLLHGVANILDDCNNQNVSNVMSAFNREPIYSANLTNASPSNRFVNSPPSRKSDSSSPEQTNQSSLNTASNFIQNSVIEKHIPFLQDGLNIQSDFGSFSTCNEPSTVDASVLGFSSFSTVPARVSPISSDQFGGNQMTSPPAQVTSTLASFTTHMPHTSVPRTAAPPVQVSTAYEKMFPYQNPVQLLKPDPNKFPTVKVSLPPSTGEILVVPDKTDPTKMTFHLLAQPHASLSQPIQSCLELRANTSSTSPVNQPNESLEIRTRTENSPVASSKRKSPLMNVPQFPNGLSFGPQQLLEKNVSGANFSSLLKPAATFPSFTTNSNNPPISSTYVSSFLPMNTNVINQAAVTKSDYQLVRPPSYNILSANQNRVPRPSGNVSFSPDNSNALFQTGSSYKTVSSTISTTALPSYRMSSSSKGARPKLNSPAQKEAPSNIQKVYTTNNSYLFSSNGVVPNGSGQFEIVTVPKADGIQQMPRFQSPDRQPNQNILKSFSEGITTAYYPPSFTNQFQNYTFPTASLNPPLVYAQVTPNQPSQFVNIPNYMIANQNMFQHPLNHQVMNVQPFPVPNRPVISMDLGSR